MKKGKALVTGGPSGYSLPPAFQASVVCRHKFYYYVNASATAEPVTVTNFFTACGAVVTTANTGVTAIATAFKIGRIRIWSAILSGAADATQANVEWATALTTFDPDMEKDRLFPSGTSMTGATVFKPPPKSLGQFWINTAGAGSGTICSISAVKGSIIELSISFILRNNFAQLSPVTVTTSSATLGTLGYLPLDGPGGKFSPAGVPIFT
jgi:hypothetical protein